VAPKLQSNDHLLVEIKSQDVWIKVISKMNATELLRVKSDFEIKVDFSWTGKELKKII